MLLKIDNQFRLQAGSKFILTLNLSVKAKVKVTALFLVAA